MGWKSTADITREEAEEWLRQAIETASDEDLCAALEAIMGEHHGSNYRIVQESDS